MSSSCSADIIEEEEVFAEDHSGDTAYFDQIMGHLQDILLSKYFYILMYQIINFVMKSKINYFFNVNKIGINIYMITYV